MQISLPHLLLIVYLIFSFGNGNSSEQTRPNLLEIKADLDKTEKQLSSLKKQKIMYTTAASLTLGTLYYLPEYFTRDFSPSHINEALLRNTILVVGVNCGKQAYELQKTILELINKKNRLVSKLGGHTPPVSKDVCKQGSLCFKENLLFSFGIFCTVGLWYCLPALFEQDYSFNHLAEAAARTSALTVGGNCLVELYETKKAQSDAQKSEFLVPLQKTPPAKRVKPPVLDLTKLNPEYSGEYANVARARRHNSMPSPHKKSSEFE